MQWRDGTSQLLDYGEQILRKRNVLREPYVVVLVVLDNILVLFCSSKLQGGSCRLSKIEEMRVEFDATNNEQFGGMGWKTIRICEAISH